MWAVSIASMQMGWWNKAYFGGGRAHVPQNYMHVQSQATPSPNTLNSFWPHHTLTYHNHILVSRNWVELREHAGIFSLWLQLCMQYSCVEQPYVFKAGWSWGSAISLGTKYWSVGLNRQQKEQMCKTVHIAATVPQPLMICMEFFETFWNHLSWWLLIPPGMDIHIRHLGQESCSFQDLQAQHWVLDNGDLGNFQPVPQGHSYDSPKLL